MNNVSFPNVPFVASFKKVPNKESIDVEDIVAAGNVHGVAESVERDEDLRRREIDHASAMEEAAREKEFAMWMDQYDGHAKLERGQGNRKFVMGLAKGAGAVVAVIAVVEIVTKLAR